MIFRFLLLALWSVVTQADYLGGVWPSGERPPSAVLYASRVAEQGGTPQVKVAAYVHTLVPQGTTNFEWGITSVLDSYSHTGEHTPLYTKAIKRGNAPVWGGVFEVREKGSEGAAFGIEVDVMGAQNRTTWGAGILLVAGRDSGAGKAVIDHGIWIAPYWPDRFDTTVNYGVKVELPCNVACVSIPAGQWITFDRDGQVGMYFDEATGFLHFGVKGKPPAMSLQMETGEIRH